MRYRYLTLGAVGIVLTILVTLVVLDGAVTGGLLGRVILRNVGIVKAIGVGVYWDSGCTDPVTSVDWGTVEPGSAEDVMVYIKNEGSAPVTLALETENWNPPSVSTYMSLTWNYTGGITNVGEVVQVTFSLSVSDTIEGITSFSFDIVIIGSG